MDSLGESVLNLVIGFITVIINFILTVICLIGDLVITTFDFLATPYKFTMVANAIKIGDLNLVSFCQSCFIPMGIAISTIIFFLTLYQTALSPIVSGGEKIGRPISIVGRFIVTIIAVVASSRLCDLVFYVAKKFLVGLAKMGNYALGLVTVGDTWSLTETFNSADAFNGTDLGEATAAQSALAEATNLPTSIIAVASNLAQLLLVGFLVCVIAWNLFQFYLEIFERYAVLIGITSIAPLTIATAASPLTEKIAKSWLSFFMGEIVLWVSQYFSLVVVKVVLGSLDSFQENFSTGTQGLFVWAGMSYAFINFARHADDYINKLGLTAARTGEGLFKDIGSMVAAGKMVGGVAKAAGNTAVGAGRLAGKTASATASAGKTVGKAGKGALLGATQGVAFIHSAGASGAEYAKTHGKNVAAGAVKGAGAAVAGAAVAGAKNKASAATSAATAPIRNASNAFNSNVQKGASAGKTAHDANVKKKLDANDLQQDGSKKFVNSNDGEQPYNYELTNKEMTDKFGMQEQRAGEQRTYEHSNYDSEFTELKDRGKEVVNATDRDSEGNVVGFQSKTFKDSDDKDSSPKILEEEQFRFESSEFEKEQKIAGSKSTTPSKTTTNFESDNQKYEAITTKNAKSTGSNDKYTTSVYSVNSSGEKKEVSSFKGSTNSGVEVASTAHAELHSKKTGNPSKSPSPSHTPQASSAQSRTPKPAPTAGSSSGKTSRQSSSHSQRGTPNPRNFK